MSHPELLSEAKLVSKITRMIRQSCQVEVSVRHALINGTHPTQCPSGKVQSVCQMGIEWDWCHL